ncbi:KAP family P-loop NTPase fold protein [Paenibacillus turpanensis]|uniref:KAP family P-loop NTPase fold protein n=1 Tax=Paenibacillus turpanensis TaxID=2689078 RepID=UPI00140DB79C|nr:P-loop NTPase fold protein [Paenibacillus turpanensis]
MFEKFKRSKNNDNIRKYFLEDKPLQKINDDKFQYSQVAEILYELLKQNNFPTHIGLFAPWGSGKTSVIKLLERILEVDKANGDNFIIKVISVWKFADDAPSLHRKIVREVQAELNVHDEEGLNNESTKSESVTGAGIFSILFLESKLYRWSIVGFLLIMLISIVISVYLKSAAFTSIASGLISVSTIALVVGALKIFIGSYQRGSQLSVKTIPLTHGDQYEARFKASVNKFLEKNDGSKLVLVFDDLDRLPPKQLLAALNTIKTFLHSKDCAFIIPCDEGVLRNGIKAAFEQKDILEDAKSDDKYVSEFINKTFDYQIHLPILEQKNMKRYAKQLLLDQEIQWLEDSDINIDKVLGILIHSSIKTPRQVKALLNSFSSNWQLAKKRDHESGKKLLSANSLAIAVFTVLQTDFPEYFMKLISDPYLITRNEECKDGNSDGLNAFLTRVEKCIPKNDPRPFIYFSNEKLNPVTGKPELIKIKDYLLNAQVEEFKSSYEILNARDKEILFSSVISDFDDNPGIEVENCIKTLIEADTELNVISDMDIHNWDLLLRDNIDILKDFPPSKVCRLLTFLSYDNTTWSEYGSKIVVSEYSSDLLRLWIDNPVYISKMAIPNLAPNLEDAFIQNNDGYSLAASIFEASSEHKIINSLDWLRVIRESLDTNVEAEYKLASWLRTWATKSNNPIQVALITELVAAYDFKTEAFLEGTGELWCDSYVQNDVDLAALIMLMDREEFCGFTDTDFEKINEYMAKSTYKHIRDVVRPLLDQWWEDEKFEKVNKYLTTFPRSPGVSGFCETNFDFSIGDYTQEIFLDIVVERANTLGGIPNIIKKIQSEFDSAVNQQRASKTPAVIKTLLQSEKLRGYLTTVRENLMPINDNLIWLGWCEQVVNDRLDVFHYLWAEDEAAKNWIFDCVITLASVSQNYLNSGRPYNNNASRYLNIFIESLCDSYKDIDWDAVVTEWVSLPMKNNSNVKIDLFSILDSTTRSTVIGQLSRRCNLGCEEFNALLIKFLDASVNSHREAISARWEVIGEENRKVMLEKWSNNLESEGTKEVINLTITSVESNPLADYMEELVEWDIEDRLRQTLLTILIDKLPYDYVVNWVNEAMDSMNKNGFHKWKGHAIEVAISYNKINVRNVENMLEVALGLGKDRARLALQLLLASDLSRIEIRRFRDRIVDLYNEYPDYVDKFGFRFKLKKEVN